MSEINVTPLVDVMLVLLVIFMITAPMRVHGIDMSIPKTKGGTVLPVDRIILSVGVDGKVRSDTHGIPPIAVAELGTALRRAVSPAARADARSVYVRAEKDVPFVKLMETIDQVKDAGFAKVGLLKEPG